MPRTAPNPYEGHRSRPDRPKGRPVGALRVLAYRHHLHQGPASIIEDGTPILNAFSRN